MSLRTPFCPHCKVSLFPPSVIVTYFKQYSDGIPRPKESFQGFSQEAFDDAIARLSKFLTQRKIRKLQGKIWLTYQHMTCLFKPIEGALVGRET